MADATGFETVLTNEYYRDRPIAFAPDLFKDKVVMISGGATGIGKAAAWQVARLGGTPIICARSIDKLIEVSSAINAAGLKGEHQQLDIRDREKVDEFVDSIYARHGRLDLQINSAGGQFIQPAIDYSVKGWRSVVENNLNGTFNMMQSVARKWFATDSKGSIVCVTFSPRGIHQMAHSLAARAGIMAFAEAVAVEWAPQIRINCVAPGSVASDHFSFEEQRLYCNSNPLLDTGTPWDLAAACLFLGGDTSPFITGQTLHVNGGANLWGEVWPLGKPERYRKATEAWTSHDAEQDRLKAAENARIKYSEQRKESHKKQ